MYHAIVFLPLVGFLIAGIFGKKIGARASEVITTSLLAVACALSWVAFVRVGFYGEAAQVKVASWIVSGSFSVDWAFRIDTLTAVMLIVVTTVSMLVHLYSIGYMHEDPARPRFFAYLSLFTFAMLMLVTADNLLQMFFGWEGVGLASYLLIGFWYEKPSANAAAMKAFIVNRVGDFGFLARHLRSCSCCSARPPSTACSRASGNWRKRSFTSSAMALPCADGGLRCCPVHGRDGQVGAIPAAHLAAGRDGRPDPGVGADPCRHHGDGGRVHGGAACRRCSNMRRPRSPSSQLIGAITCASSPQPSASCRTTSSG
jgi:hypothetical protein